MKAEQTNRQVTAAMAILSHSGAFQNLEQHEIDRIFESVKLVAIAAIRDYQNSIGDVASSMMDEVRLF